MPKRKHHLTKRKNHSKIEKIQQIKATQASLDMLKLATESSEALKELPSDLRKRANEILYG